jgi:hypothetical protein
MKGPSGNTSKTQPAINSRTTSSQSGKDSKPLTQGTQEKTTAKPIDSKSKKLF